MCTSYTIHIAHMVNTGSLEWRTYMYQPSAFSPLLCTCAHTDRGVILELVGRPRYASKTQNGDLEYLEKVWIETELSLMERKDARMVI